ncbi:MAG: 4Fe-4S binding protein [Deltaproteobacteria bacterium]|nr:4Fe-4S binding protein [Deltaproteobacteria bacterium]
MDQLKVDEVDVYRQLARHLDNLPAGFPATESGVELRILRKLFTPEEATVALALRMVPEPAEKIAKRLQTEVAAVAARLSEMSRKGLIFRARKGDMALYMASQFVVGIWEYHVNDLNPELIEDVNEYLPFLLQTTWAGMQTKQLRVIPVAESVSPEASIMPYEVAEEIIKSQSKIVVAPCICRKEQQLVGQGCDNPMEACFSFGAAAFYYEENGLGRAVSPEEALELLHKGLAAGLVLQPSNSQKPINICMCCGCCCQVLKNIKKMPRPATMIDANYFAEVDAEQCIACGDCAVRCHMEAITVGETATVDLERCIGCGVCVPVCNYAALHLRRKEPASQSVPPATMVQTYMQMAQERGKI